MRRFLAAALMAFFVLLAAPAGDVAAHVKSTTGYSQVRSGADGTVAYELLLEYAPLVTAAGLGEDARAAGDGPARADALDAGRDALAAYLAARVELFLDGAQCHSELADTAIDERDDLPFARLQLTYACPGGSDGQYRVRYTVFSSADAVVDDHVNVVDYDLDGHRGRAIIERENPELVAGRTSLGTTLVRFGELGVEHLFGGLDHVLFVVALVLGATSLPDVLRTASMFTLAHSVTLALAVLGWVDVPAAVVEPLIALSIAYVALENVLGGRSRWRLGVVFAFGLLHGLGFAGAMSFTGDLSWPLVTSLVGFNAGIEIAQAILLMALFPLVVAVRRLPWSAVPQVAATAAVAAFGVTWFVERLSFS